MIPGEVGIIHAKLWVQLGDGEMSEVGTLRIPERATKPNQIGHTLHVFINADMQGNPFESEATISTLQGLGGVT